MNIELTTSFTAEDLQQAYNLNYKKMHPIVSRLDYVFIAIIFFFLAVSIWANLDGWMVFFWLMYAVIIAFLIYRKKITLGKRMLKKQQNLGDIHTIKITDAGIETHAPGRNGSIDWKTFSHSIISDKCILLYMNSLSFLMLMRRMFDSQKTYEQFCQFVKEKITKTI